AVGGFPSAPLKEEHLLLAKKYKCVTMGMKVGWDGEKENGARHYCRTLPVLFDSYVGSFPSEALKEQ
ncbi:MAG: hypothetical protein ACXWME_09990, partial [Syntrophales bacterium]